MIDRTRHYKLNGVTYYHGEKVTCVIERTEVTNAKISLNQEGINTTAFICQNLKAGSSANNTLGYYHSWVTSIHNNEGCTKLKKLKADDLGEIIYSVICM